MTTPPKTGPQDMPPPGGYEAIQFARVKLRQIFTAKRTVALFIAAQVSGWYLFQQAETRVRKHNIETRGARYITHTLLEAEKDREMLKNLRRNREYERDLMKDYPDWEVGTYFGEPIYETIDVNETWFPPTFSEYTVHADDKETTQRFKYRYYV